MINNHTDTIRLFSRASMCSIASARKLGFLIRVLFTVSASLVDVYVLCRLDRNEDNVLQPHELNALSRWIRSHPDL